MCTTANGCADPNRDACSRWQYCAANEYRHAGGTIGKCRSGEQGPCNAAGVWQPACFRRHEPAGSGAEFLHCCFEARLRGEGEALGHGTGGADPKAGRGSASGSWISQVPTVLASSGCGSEPCSQTASEVGLDFACGAGFRSAAGKHGSRAGVSMRDERRQPYCCVAIQGSPSTDGCSPAIIV